jgi:hypothetical protein
MNSGIDIVTPLKELVQRVEALGAPGQNSDFTQGYRFALANVIEIAQGLQLQIAKQDAEIERLKVEVAQLQPWVDKTAVLASEKVDMQRLLARAADALEEHVYVKRSSNLNVDVSELIDELRHAADLMIDRPDSVPKDQGAVQDCADRSGPYSNPID